MDRMQGGMVARNCVQDVSSIKHVGKFNETVSTSGKQVREMNTLLNPNFI